MDAAKEVGLGITEDLVGPKPLGFTVAQAINANGVRLSSPRAYLWPHKNRKNLHVALNATVTRINTQPYGSKVITTGVTFYMVRLHFFFTNLLISMYV